jgi:pSer/pThr/pTyr-binding forkhead associated (FHA) protein
VSSWHAVIKFDGRTARVEDLGTVNGFLVDGTRVEAGKSVEVRGRLVVTIGPIELIVEHTPAETRRPASAEPVPTPSELLHVRDRRSAQGAIDSDEPALLSSGHTMAMNLSKVHGAGAQAAPAVRASSARRRPPGRRPTPRPSASSRRRATRTGWRCCGASSRRSTTAAAAR